MYLALRSGNGPVLLPAAYRRQYESRGWRMATAPEGYAPVSSPTPISQASKIEAAPPPKKKRRRRKS
ncbi:MAG: hypothetical protein RKU31_31945 [Deltaproteobacteria bacterium]|jgi:hypothetical protein